MRIDSISKELQAQIVKDINEAEKLAIIRASEIYRAKHINDFGNQTCLNTTINNLISEDLYKINKNSKYTIGTTIYICLNSIEIGD